MCYFPSRLNLGYKINVINDRWWLMSQQAKVCHKSMVDGIETYDRSMTAIVKTYMYKKYTKETAENRIKKY